MHIFAPLWPSTQTAAQLELQRTDHAFSLSFSQQSVLALWPPLLLLRLSWDLAFLHKDLVKIFLLRGPTSFA